jgi:hypothetical protein
MNLQYMGHNLVLLPNFNRTFRCTQCKCDILISGSSEYTYKMYYDNDHRLTDPITCNEMIIKNIIE